MNRSFTPTTLDPSSSTTTGGMLDESFRSVALDDADAGKTEGARLEQEAPCLAHADEAGACSRAFLAVVSTASDLLLSYKQRVGAKGRQQTR